jgi:hypothetical protein
MVQCKFPSTLQSKFLMRPHVAAQAIPRLRPGPPHLAPPVDHRYQDDASSTGESGPGRGRAAVGSTASADIRGRGRATARRCPDNHGRRNRTACLWKVGWLTVRMLAGSRLVGGSGSAPVVSTVSSRSLKTAAPEMANLRVAACKAGAVVTCQAQARWTAVDMP